MSGETSGLIPLGVAFVAVLGTLLGGLTAYVYNIRIEREKRLHTDRARTFDRRLPLYADTVAELNTVFALADEIRHANEGLKEAEAYLEEAKGKDEETLRSAETDVKRCERRLKRAWGQVERVVDKGETLLASIELVADPRVRQGVDTLQRWLVHVLNPDASSTSEETEGARVALCALKELMRADLEHLGR